LDCATCGATFYGRADARYCCGACRQKGYRARSARRAALDAPRRPELGGAAARAREIRQRAQAARENAASTQKSAASLRARIGAPVR
jgi:hypothetical protein